MALPPGPKPIANWPGKRTLSHPLPRIFKILRSKLIDVSPHVPLPQQTAGSRQLQSSTNDARPSVSSDGPGYSYDPADLQHSPPDSPSATFASLKAKASASAPPIQPLPPQYDFLRLFRETFPPQPSKGHSLAEPAQDQGLLNGAHDKDGSDSDNSQSSNSTLRQKERDWLQSIIERDGQSRRWDPDLVRGTSNTAADEHDGEKKLLFWF
ncbi:MAG: hypothetical protein M1831_004112 [Alyxoria varia]|nr:MAG: hypothetical protein M1831_004112 [Alyxoria varia]